MFHLASRMASVLDKEPRREVCCAALLLYYLSTHDAHGLGKVSFEDAADFVVDAHRYLQEELL